MLITLAVLIAAYGRGVHRGGRLEGSRPPPPFSCRFLHFSRDFWPGTPIFFKILLLDPPPPLGVSSRKMRKHHGTWRFGFRAAHNLRAIVRGAQFARCAQFARSAQFAVRTVREVWGMLLLEILIRKLLYMHFGGLLQ